MICAICNRTIETPIHPESWPSITCCSQECATKWQVEMTFKPSKSLDQYELDYLNHPTITLISPTGETNQLIASPATVDILETLLSQGWTIKRQNDKTPAKG